MICVGIGGARSAASQAFSLAANLHYTNGVSQRCKSKSKGVPYTFVLKGEPVRENTYSEPSACEVG